MCNLQFAIFAFYQNATPTRSPPPAAMRMMDRLLEMIPAAERPIETTPMYEGGNLAMMAWKAPKSKS